MNDIKKVAVFYHYFEANDVYRDNLIYFLSKAYSTDLNFFIVISENCSIELPERDNIKYIYTKNNNNDFGGYSSALRELKSINGYDYFIFVNSSVRGPFIPNFFQGCWSELFLSHMSDEVHLVSSTINILPTDVKSYFRFKELYDYPEPYSHVQTTAYAMSYRAIKHLLDTGFYNMDESLNKIDVICHYELKLSQELIRQGWNLKCFLKEYNQIDYRKPHEDINFTSKEGDPLFNESYFGRTAHPTELVFIKTNRNMISEKDLHSHTYCQLLDLQLNWEAAIELRERMFETLNKPEQNSSLDLLRKKIINKLEK